MLLGGLIVAVGAIIGISVEFYQREHKEKHWVAWFSSGCIVVTVTHGRACTHAHTLAHTRTRTRKIQHTDTPSRAQVLTVPLALFEIARHLRHWHKPVLQGHVVRLCPTRPHRVDGARGGGPICTGPQRRTDAGTY